MNTKEEILNEDIDSETSTVDLADSELNSKSDNKEIDYLEGWKRCQADFQNYKREEAKRSQDMILFANNNLILDILSAIDIFDLAEKHVPEDIKQNHKQWLDGFFYGVRELQKQLEVNGLEKIVANDVEFNPIEHEIVGGSDSDSNSGNKVYQVRAGYKLKGRLLRPAQVSFKN